MAFHLTTTASNRLPLVQVAEVLAALICCVIVQRGLCQLSEHCVNAIICWQQAGHLRYTFRLGK